VTAAFLAGAFVAAVVAGGVATISGFGVGSLLTPLFGVASGTKTAVVLVSIPHAVATALRLWIMREHVDRHLLRGFGLLSAGGGLLGALLQTRAESGALALVLASLLILSGVLGLTGLSERLRFRGWVGWIAGGASGLLGGLVGNQGGIRAGAMLGFDVSPAAFVATSTAVGLVVDAVRVPVYLATQGGTIATHWLPVVVASAGAVLGTVVGVRVLRRVPQRLFKTVVAWFLLALGVWVGLRVR
jgi:uncharacterized membrane protein YfcA